MVDGAQKPIDTGLFTIYINPFFGGVPILLVSYAYHGVTWSSFGGKVACKEDQRDSHKA